MDTPLEVDVTTAAQLLGAGALLLDVREPGEVATCAVAGSRHIPMRQIPENLTTLPADDLRGKLELADRLLTEPKII